MYPAHCRFYSKFFIYKQTGLSQLFIVLLALILTFMSLLLTYHSLVYMSVPACALELGPGEPWPGARSLMGVMAASEMGHQHPSKALLPARGPDHGDTRKEQGKGWKGGQDSLWGVFVALPRWPGPSKPAGEAALGAGNASLQQNHQPPAPSSSPAGALVLHRKGFSSLSPLPPLADKLTARHALFW